jgi:hypothetical protein
VQVWVPLIAWPATAQVVPEPVGVVLIFSCWNFPLGMNRITNHIDLFPCITYSYTIRDANIAIAMPPSSPSMCGTPRS